MLSACGYVAGPLPPLANIPASIGDLDAVQRGSRIIVHFTLPQHTTEGMRLQPPLDLDLRIGAFSPPFNVTQWSDQATRIAQGEIKGDLATYEIPSGPWTGKDVAIAARTIGANHKPSNWSNHISLPIIAPLEQPQDLTTVTTAQGIHLTWRARGDHFRLLRRTGAGPDFSQVAVTQQPEWTDPNVQYGTRYTYVVQTFAELPDHREAQSDLSAEVSETPIDKFPPAAPAGLRASVAPNSIELSWDRNTEADLAGYRVYRATGSGGLEKIADVNEVPTYSDHQVEAGKTYRYTITAVDQAGNESPKSATVEAAVQQ